MEVVKELERNSNPNSAEPDRPCEWAKSNRELATRHGTDYAALKQILSHPQVRRVVDQDKIGVEEADPYVLALAYKLRETHNVTVLTEETRDRPDKLSMNTACGLLKLVSLRMEAFLEDRGIWP